MIYISAGKTAFVRRQADDHGDGATRPSRRNTAATTDSTLRFSSGEGSEEYAKSAPPTEISHASGACPYSDSAAATTASGDAWCVNEDFAGASGRTGRSRA